MSKSEIKGKDILLKRTPYTLFTLFSDLRMFAASLPEDKRAQITVNEDSISTTVSGMTFGVRISEKEPYSNITMVDTGQSPLSFMLKFSFLPVGLDSTLFHIELVTELNTMMKMMIGGKLQEMVDKLSDQIELAINEGIIPDIPNDISF